MQGKVDLLAIGLLEQLLSNTEQRLQLQGLKELTLPALSALATEHLADVQIDPMVMAIGRFIWANAQRRVS